MPRKEILSGFVTVITNRIMVSVKKRSNADFTKEVSDPKLDSYVVKRKDIDKLSKINQGYIFIHIPAKLVSKSQGKKDEVISLSGKSHDQVDLAMAEWALHNASLQEDHEKVSTCMIEIDRLKEQIKRKKLIAERVRILKIKTENEGDFDKRGNFWTARRSSRKVARPASYKI
ncbi:unnamed protein product [Oikopleura dioica]|uniref:Uncharacterized protein n=1 Tax=Oikopleura dioica TaxID=34765 RepID=E4WR47_OIKDI|nr:unnamed protein product [Oikopleura dioica]